MFSLNDQVLVKERQIRGNISEVKRGMVVSVSAERVSIQFPGEFKPKDYPVDQVESAKTSFGLGTNSDNFYEKQIPKLYR